MSSNARNAEKRRDNDTAYERELEERNQKEAEFRRTFGTPEATLEGLGIDPYLLVEYLAEKLAGRRAY